MKAIEKVDQDKRLKAVFETESTSFGEGIESLLCPNCGSEYLHLQQVNVIERHDDAGHGLYVRVGKDSNGDPVMACDSRVPMNGGFRRNSVSLVFGCEGCEGETCYSFNQHKGLTYVDHVFNAVERKAGSNGENDA